MFKNVQAILRTLQNAAVSFRYNQKSSGHQPRCCVPGEVPSMCVPENDTASQVGDG